MNGYDNHEYAELRTWPTSYVMTLLVLVAVSVLGFWCAWQLDHHGHHLTGMNNKIVWGLPHIFAILLIVTASGVLNIATISSVFGQDVYKPYARLSALMAITFLMGGLTVLVFDLGRPDRLVVAITHYNFHSIFAWNILLYTGFIIIVGIYLWTMMERRQQPRTPAVGTFALIWRLILTSGTGSIFGFLVGRGSYDSAILAPLFVTLSLAMGVAVFILLVVLIRCWFPLPVDVQLIKRLGRLLAVFSAATLYFSLVHFVTNAYAAEHSQDVWQTLFSGSRVSWIYWLGHVVIGTLVPVTLLLKVEPALTTRLTVLCVAAVIGGVSLLYTVIIGGQEIVLRLFPGMEVVDTRLGPTELGSYTPSLWELGLGATGIAMALILTLLGLRVMGFLPVQLLPESRSAP